MIRKPLLVFAVAFMMLVSLSSLVGAEDEKKAPADAPPPKKWTIRLDGYGGTPADRSDIELALKHDGQLIVKHSRRRKPLQTVFEGKVAADDAEQFYRVATKIIQDNRRKTKNGGWSDGWNLMLSGPNGAAEFEDQRHIKDLAPGSDELATILRRYLTKRELEGLLER